MANTSLRTFLIIAIVGTLLFSFVTVYSSPFLNSQALGRSSGPPTAKNVDVKSSPKNFSIKLGDSKELNVTLTNRNSSTFTASDFYCLVNGTRCYGVPVGGEPVSFSVARRQSYSYLFDFQTGSLTEGKYYVSLYFYGSLSTNSSKYYDTEKAIVNVTVT
jgi:hypothetical protein